MLALPTDVNLRWFMPGRPLVIQRRSWREWLAHGLNVLAAKLVGFDSEEAFGRARAAILRSENDVGSNRVPRGNTPVFLPTAFIIGKTSGAIAKGATNGSVTIWDSTTNAAGLAASSTTLTSVYNPFADVATTKFVLVIQMGWGYMLCAAEC